MPTANGHITLNTPVIVRSSVFSLVKKKEKIKLDMPGFEPRTIGLVDERSTTELIGTRVGRDFATLN